MSAGPAGRPEGERPTSSFGRETALYMGIRLALFLVALIVLILVGLNGLLAALVALLVSGLVSYPLARRQRDRIVESYRDRDPRKRRRQDP